MDKNSTIELHSGNEMPVIGLGTWQLKENTPDTIAYALDIGYRMIDTSGDYGTQPGIGEGIRKNGVDRSQIYLVTKVEETDDSYEKTRQDLQELGLDYADLMLIHRPPKDGAGVELWQGLIRARDEGLTRDIGVSNYPAHLIDELIEATGETPAVNQIEWSPFGHSDDMQRYARDKGIIIQAYSPLTRQERLNNEELDKIADKYGVAPAQLMIRWNLQRGTVPLPKANKREHLEEDIDVFGFEIETEDMEKLNRMNEHYSALGELPYE